MQFPLAVIDWYIEHFLLSGTATASPVFSDHAMAMQARQSTRTLGFIGCSMAENVAQGYVSVGGKRLWEPYGTSGMVCRCFGPFLILETDLPSTCLSGCPIVDKQQLQLVASL